MAAISLIGGSILGWMAAFIATAALGATIGKAAFVFFATSLGFACSVMLLARVRGMLDTPR